MKLISARSSCAPAPISTAKRAPEIFAARSKSRPRAAPISSCSFGVKANCRFSPHSRTSALADSSGPSGTSADGRFGRPESCWRSASENSRSLASRVGIRSLSCATSAIRAAAPDSSFLALAAPIAFDASFRRACASWSAVTVSRSALSCSRMAAACGSRPRRASPASKLSGFCRMKRMSCMARVYEAPRRARQARNPRASSCVHGCSVQEQRSVP